MIIYKATNIINGKCYIGQTTHSIFKRRKGHKADMIRKNYPFSNALVKYGWDNFTWLVLCKCDTKEELDKMERHYIKQFGDYNLTEGGDNNPMFHDECRKKLSVLNSGKNNPNYGKTHSQETRQRMSDNHAYIDGKMNPNYGNRGRKNPLSKKWLVIDPEGNEQVIIGLEYFCKENNLTPACMNLVASGRNKQHKGWKCKKL